MTQDEIISMALECGIDVSNGKSSEVWAFDLETFADIVAANEREACAKVCERLISGDGICADDGIWIHDCAAAIRARNNKE